MSTNAPRVLLIDSEADLRSLNELILREAGDQVQILPPNADPVAFAKHASPDAIVVYIRPNHPEDWRIIDSLNADATTDKIPIVVLSTSERTLAEAQAAPVVTRVVVMPYDIDALQRAVAEALKHPPPAAVLPPSAQPPPAALAVAGQILHAHGREIILRVLSRLQQIEPFQARFAELSPGVVNCLPKIMSAMLVGLQRGLTPDQALAPPEIRHDIVEHVELRVRQGLDASAMLLEYQTLNDEMLAFLGDHLGEAKFSAIEAFDVARVLNGFVGKALRIVGDDLLVVIRHPDAIH
ncbi:MAG: hypothetical protein ACRDIY_18150 [Chloroflexota bacterium]